MSAFSYPFGVGLCNLFHQKILSDLWDRGFSSNRAIIAIPLKNPLLIRIPPYYSHFSNKGGILMSAPQAKNLWGFRIKIVWTTLRKHSESMIFEEKIVFSKRKTPKFSRLRRGYYPSNYSKCFSRCSKSNYSKILTMFKKQLFKSNYPKRLMTFKSNYSKAIIQKDW